MQSLVSVCIPVYNGEKFIKEAVETALNQKYDNLEVIVVDNCSTDSTVEIVKSVNNPKLRLVVNDSNLGMVGNWNKCIKEAKGDYINLLCADDRLKEDCVAKKAAILDEHPNVVLVSSDTDIISETGEVMMKRKGLRKTGVYSGTKIFRKSIHSRNLYGEPTNVLFRKCVVNKTDGYSGGLPYSPDWEFWLHLSTLGDVGYISEALSEYRVSSVSATDSLLKNKNKLKEDSERFFNCVSNYAPVSKRDIRINRRYQKFRTFEKQVFYKFLVRN